MSQENVELVRQAFEGAGVRGLRETAETYWQAELEYVEDPGWPGASSHQGRDAVLRCFWNYLDALGREQDLLIEVERVVDAGMRQVPFVRVRSVSSSEVPHDHLWGYVVEVKDGRVIYSRAYYEPARALEAVGLRE